MGSLLGYRALVCKECGAKFRSNKPNQVYCSAVCRRKGYNKVYWDRSRGRSKIARFSKPCGVECPVCGDVFYTSNPEKVYCSRKCKERSARQGAQDEFLLAIKKGESWRMALELIRNGKISLDMACDCLRLSHHKPEEINNFRLLHEHEVRAGLVDLVEGL